MKTPPPEVSCRQAARLDMPEVTIPLTLMGGIRSHGVVKTLVRYAW